MAVNFGADNNLTAIFNRLGQIGQSGSYTPQMKLPKPKPQSLLQPFSGLPQVSGPSGGVTGGIGSVPGDLGRLMRAIRGQESGGNYRATNPSGATGAYQILWSNLAANNGKDWDRQALGRDVSYNEFLNSPSIQDAIAKFKLGQLLKSRGMAGAAATWYGGDYGYNHMYDRKPQPGGYPSMYEYVMSILNKAR